MKLRCGSAVSVARSHPGGERGRNVVDRSDGSTKRPCDGYISLRCISTARVKSNDYKYYARGVELKGAWKIIMNPFDSYRLLHHVKRREVLN